MNHIQIVGLGAGTVEQLPLGIYRQLLKTDRLYLRTKEHPVVSELEKEGVAFKSFDHIYEKHDGFEEVYKEITDSLFKKAEAGDLLYAVPGHPMAAERTVQLLLEQADQRQVHVTVGGGQSFLDSLFTAVRVDPVEGFQLLDGTLLSVDPIQMTQHVIIAQVYDQFVASDVKLALMEKYPDDYEVAIVTAAGSQHEQVRRLPLYELDRTEFLDNLTSLYVPPVQQEDLLSGEFSQLKKIIAQLRGPEGCPWDREQTHASLKKYLIEESYELLAAIDEDDIDHLIEELGDVLLQVMLHAQIGEDDGMFSVRDVVKGITEKMVRRHPHVFGGAASGDAKEMKNRWEQIKADEKKPGEEAAYLLDTVEKGFPALLRAYELQKTAAKVGFDWGNAAEGLEKVKEETEEFEVELAKGDSRAQLDEMGDMLFTVINAARLAGIHPEEALQAANEKFYRRFSHVEMRVKESGRTFDDFTLDELDAYWCEAKKLGK